MIRSLGVICVLAIASGWSLALSLFPVRALIEVDVDFHGDSVVVFALSEVPDSAEITYAFALIGPVSRHRVARRRGKADVFYAPSILSVAVEPELYDGIAVELRREADLDPVGLIRPSPVRLHAGPPDPEWYEALGRLKTDAGLFHLGGGVTRLEGGLVRADLPLPEQSPVGDYRVRAVIFRNSGILSEAESGLTLRRQGAEGFLYSLSRRSGFVYGLLAVLVAVMAGAMGAWVGRR